MNMDMRNRASELARREGEGGRRLALDAARDIEKPGKNTSATSHGSSFLGDGPKSFGLGAKSRVETRDK